MSFHFQWQSYCKKLEKMSWQLKLEGSYGFLQMESWAHTFPESSLHRWRYELWQSCHSYWEKGRERRVKWVSEPGLFCEWSISEAFSTFLLSCFFLCWPSFLFSFCFCFCYVLCSDGEGVWMWLPFGFPWILIFPPRKVPICSSWFIFVRWHLQLFTSSSIKISIYHCF